MAQSVTERSNGLPILDSIRGMREGAAIALLGLAIFIAMALLSYSPADRSWSFDQESPQVDNLVGASGALIADMLFMVLGVVAYLLPIAVVVAAVRLWIKAPALTDLSVPLRVAAWMLIALSLALLAAVHMDRDAWSAGAGGIVGWSIAEVAVPALGVAGASLFAWCLVLAASSIAVGFSWLRICEMTGRFVRTGSLVGARSLGEWLDARRLRRQHINKRKVQQRAIEEVQLREAPKVIAPAPKPVESKRVVHERQKELFQSPTNGPAKGLPKIDLLDEAEAKGSRGYSAESLEALSRMVELKLQDFGVEGQVVAVLPGPVVTRFEYQPAPGVKVSKISALVKDLARSLAVISVRVVEVIPGRSVVGIEIPNEDRETVRLRDILATEAYEESESPLTLALGKDISGESIVADLTRMPHLLIAGTTGSGKSVGVNAMILSLLLKSEPSDVRMILIDPKMLELSVYEGIPHLLSPVVTDMQHAAAALRWCVAEMDRRYQLMATLGVRNLAGFNRKVEQANEKGTPLIDPLSQVEGQEPRQLEHLPYIVVMIDEFADMMMLVGKKVEELIARIAQKARAAGIHLILATQRPSVDVITGLIKANIPGRLSFQVSSKVDSRTILDQGGAEQLLGHGDMLFLPPGTSTPVRIHGAFVSDEEVHRVVHEWRRRGEPDYLPDILETEDSSESNVSLEGSAEVDDDLYDEAVAFVLESRRASISSVQRRFRIGYNRAARLIEAMEAAGLVSSMGSSGGREVLVPDRE